MMDSNERSEDDEARRKTALKILLSYSTDVMDYSVDSNKRENDSKTLIFGNNSFVSFVRGMDRSYNDRMSTIAHSTPVNSKSSKTPCLGSPYLESLDLAESDFFDSETGKEMILNDQASYERLFKEGTDCTGCSSWTPCSRKNMSSLSTELPGFTQKESISVGEFIGRFSETLSFSDIHKKQNFFANCFTSTPKKKRKSRSMSSFLDMESKEFSSLDHRRNESSCTIATPTSIKPLDFSLPRCIGKSNHSEDFHYFIGQTTRKNIDRVRKEERRTRDLEETVSFDSLQADQTVTSTKGSGAAGSDTATFAATTGLFALTSDSISKSYDQWFLDPQVVLLDINKGNRVRLVNNSPKNLKFKTSFDSRNVNISPLSGTVPAMGQIGLRLVISKYAKKENENFEIDIKVIIGKNDKSITVKSIRSGKSKPSKERSYIVF